MRADLDPGDVLVGVEADGLIKNRRAEKGDKTTRSRCIVYYMKIFEVLDLDRYFKDPRFQASKHPPTSTLIGPKSNIQVCGWGLFFEATE